MCVGATAPWFEISIRSNHAERALHDSIGFDRVSMRVVVKGGTVKIVNRKWTCPFSVENQDAKKMKSKGRALQLRDNLPYYSRRLLFLKKSGKQREMYKVYKNRPHSSSKYLLKKVISNNGACL